MDISLFLFSAALFVQPELKPTEIEPLQDAAVLHCEFLGVDYPVGQKIIVSKNGSISHKRCMPYSESKNTASQIVGWVELRS